MAPGPLLQLKKTLGLMIVWGYCYSEGQPLARQTGRQALALFIVDMRQSAAIAIPGLIAKREPHLIICSAHKRLGGRFCFRSKRLAGLLAMRNLRGINANNSHTATISQLHCIAIQNSLNTHRWPLRYTTLSLSPKGKHPANTQA